jgi:hypothetical protein
MKGTTSEPTPERAQMSSPADAHIPAWRLRDNDGMPAYGPDARVSGTPIVSPDGSMVSIVLVATDRNTRLIRVPAEQRVAVTRNTHTATAFVRQTRIAKSSGARILALDLKHPESEIEPRGKEQYATLCTVHHSLEFHTSISTAEARCSHPETWCAPCAADATSRAAERVYGTRAITERAPKRLA